MLLQRLILRTSLPLLHLLPQLHRESIIIVAFLESKSVFFFSLVEVNFTASFLLSPEAKQTPDSLFRVLPLIGQCFLFRFHLEQVSSSRLYDSTIIAGCYALILSSWQHVSRSLHVYSRPYSKQPWQKFSRKKWQGKEWDHHEHNGLPLGIRRVTKLVANCTIMTRDFYMKSHFTVFLGVFLNEDHQPWFFTCTHRNGFHCFLLCRKIPMFTRI